MADLDTTTDRALAPAAERPRKLRFGFLAPIAVFLALAVVFAWGLTRNAREIPSVLIGKPVPEFNLPPVEGRTLGLSSESLKGEVSLLNVFASWCAECRREHPLFMQLQANGTVPVHGLNYKDKPEDARNWLDDLGDPYTRTGADLKGRVGIDLGVYGVPETFVIGKDGRIAHKHIGALDREALEETILPLIAELRDAP
ncbi:MAG TPA: DsbE family thiol:disulfide interchange protein [Hyphomicrobiales bacterium]|nr:DsbE family thiol:disulfide interchange protein [Hyphomicrobiales bacterium]